MTAINEPRPRANDEDHEMAVECVVQALKAVAYSKGMQHNAEIAVDTLVSHGWGPKPTVSRAKLSERIDNGSHACPHCPESERVWVLHLEDVFEIVRELGIEVTDD